MTNKKEENLNVIINILYLGIQRCIRGQSSSNGNKGLDLIKNVSINDIKDNNNGGYDA